MTRSRKEAEAAGVKVAETKHHMKRRSPWHDYRERGTYMLTLVVEERKPLLGRLVAARVELTALGKAIRDEEISKISKYYPMVEVWKLCIMPDHIHMIVRVKEDLPEGKHLGQVVWGFKVGCTKAWWRMDRPGEKRSLFEKGYNDKLLLHEGQLDNWKRYLDDNAQRLAIKRLHPDLFTVIHETEVVGRSCQMVGNRFLLDNPQKMAVIVHGAYTDEEYADWRKKWLACGEAGGVLVSATIAKREKEVMREAMDRGYSIILLRENGFPPLYKPAGESFTACSEGRLLQISPWEYHMERKTISREQCLMLNRMARVSSIEPAINLLS